MRSLAPILASTVLLAACSDPSARPTVVLVTLDTTRAENLSTYGYERSTDPFLSELAERSIVFERAYSSTTWTLPSHVSMFTGLAPAEHGVWFRIEQREGRTTFPMVGDAQPLFTDGLSEAGYHLIGAAGGPYCRSLYGLARHFDEYEEPSNVAEAGAGGEWQLTGAEINRRLFEHLDAAPTDRPLFLFVNYFDAHAPYEPPQDRDYPFPVEGDLSPLLDVDALPIPMPDMTEWVARGEAILPEYEALAEALYDQELLIQDEALAALWAKLEALGRLEDALVIITADHGEMFGEQPLAYGHSDRPWEPATRVPMVVFRTGAEPARVDGPVSVQQVATTILDELELPALPPPAAGALPSLLAANPIPPQAHSELHTPDDWVHALHAGESKLWAEYVTRGEDRVPPLTYVLRAADEDAETLADPSRLPTDPVLAERLEELRAGWEAAPDLSAYTLLSDDDLAGLKAMGYVDD